jgi:hypothetical protein
MAGAIKLLGLGSEFGILVTGEFDEDGDLGIRIDEQVNELEGVAVAAMFLSVSQTVFLRDHLTKCLNDLVAEPGPPLPPLPPIDEPEHPGGDPEWGEGLD